MTGPVDGDAPPLLPPQLGRVWGTDEHGTKRGRRPSLDLEMIVTKAAQFADSDGIASLSLVRLAELLHVSANALYRYLDSRDELDVLLREHALALPPAPASGTDWQVAARDWAHRLRSRYLAHPWLADLRLTVPVTPNALGWLEALLAALESSPLPRSDILRAAALLDGFVRAHFVSQRDVAAWAAHPLSEEDLVERVAPLLDARGYGRVATMLRSGRYQQPTAETHEREFDYGLERILLGITA